MKNKNNFYTKDELKNLKLKYFGENVLISKKSSLYNPEFISLGNNVRIDDFCILSGHIEMGNYVHISAYSALYGKYGIKIGNYCGISPKCLVFSATDDFSGKYMISPLVPQKLTNIKKGGIILQDFCQLGANSTILPGIKMKEGAVTGAHSLVLKDLDEWSINFGIPCKKYKNREKDILNLVKEIKS